MEYLFVHVDNHKLYRYYNIGDKWHNSYVIEFIKGDESYRRMYWGDYSYNANREIIASFVHYLDEKPSDMFPWVLLSNVDMFDSIIQIANNEIQCKLKNDK